jgi:hypothetical protein
LSLRVSLRFISWSHWNKPALEKECCRSDC